MLFIFFFTWHVSGKLTVQCSLQTGLNNKLNWIARRNYPQCIPETSRSTDFTSISLFSIHPLHKNTSHVFYIVGPCTADSFGAIKSMVLRCWNILFQCVFSGFETSVSVSCSFSTAYPWFVRRDMSTMFYIKRNEISFLKFKSRKFRDIL